MPAPVHWGSLSSRQIAEMAASGRNLAILPVGATEQHSGHLPVDVDTLASLEVAIGVSAKTGVPILPPLAYGDSTGHRGFSGTIALWAPTLIQVVVEIGDWVYASGFKRLLLLNGHWSNLPPLQSAASELLLRHHDMLVKALSYWDVSSRVRAEMAREGEGPIAHAGDAETSIYMAMRPDLVNMAEANDERIDGRVAGADSFFSYAMRDRSPGGGTGNPLTASYDRGRELLDLIIDELAGQIETAMTEQPPATRAPSSA